LKKTLINLLVTSATLALTPFAAMAAEDNYVGAAIGARTHYGLDCAAGVSCDRSAGASGKIYFGKQLEKNFGAEVMAWRLGDGKGSVKSGSTSVAGTIDQQGIAAVGVGKLDLNNSFSLKGRLGVGYSRGHVDYAAGGSAAKSAFVPVIGIGASYAIDKNWSLNADLDRLPARVNGNTRVNANMFSLGASYKF
jgi:Outer membrane protein beta-barrel domain